MSTTELVYTGLLTPDASEEITKAISALDQTGRVVGESHSALVTKTESGYSLRISCQVQKLSESEIKGRELIALLRSQPEMSPDEAYHKIFQG